MERDFTKELESFRKSAINFGIIAETQADAVSFEMVDEKELMKFEGQKIQRCNCQKCQSGHQFFAIAIDSSRISPLQQKMLIMLYSSGMDAPLEMVDCGVMPRGGMC